MPDNRLATLELPQALNSSTLLKLNGDLNKMQPGKQKIVFLRGSVEGIFCQGMDLGTFSRDRETETAPALYGEFLLALRSLPTIIVSVVEGEALGGGVGIAAASDYVLATTQSSFALPEAIFGLSPAFCIPFLKERMAQQKIKAWALSAERLTAEQASCYGLVDLCVEPDKLESNLASVQRKFSRCTPASLELIKNQLSLSGPLLVDAIQDAARITSLAIKSPQVQARIKSWESGGAPWMS